MRSPVGPTGPKGALRRLFRVPVYLYRWKCGWLLGHRFLLLNHTGRRTGLPRHTVLEVLEYREDGPEAVVMSAFGPGASWLRNIGPYPAASWSSVHDALQRRIASWTTKRRQQSSPATSGATASSRRSSAGC